MGVSKCSLWERSVLFGNVFLDPLTIANIASPRIRGLIASAALAVIGMPRAFNVGHVLADPHPNTAYGFAGTLMERVNSSSLLRAC